MRIKRCVVIIASLFFLSVFKVYADGDSVGVMLWTRARTHDETMIGFNYGVRNVGLNLDVEILNANGSKKKAVSILTDFQTSKKDLIVVYGTNGYKIAQDVVKTVPVLALGVNLRLKYGMSSSANKNSLISGSSYYINPEKQLRFFKVVYPRLKKIGIIYNPENGASQIEIPSTEFAAKTLGLELVKQEIERDFVKGELESYELFAPKIEKAVLKVIDKVDAIVVPSNSEIYDNIEYVLNVSNQHKKPVFSYSRKGVQLGALAGLSVSNHKLGEMAASIVVKVLLDNENPGLIPFKFDKAPRRIVNVTAAKKINYNIPIIALETASEVIHD